MPRLGAVSVLFVWMALSPALAGAQAAAPAAPAAPGLLKIFLDCDRCDADYIRQNVGFVDYVRDRLVADVHVFVTTEQTGGGGLAWTVRFIGVGGMAGRDRTLTFTTLQDATEDDRRTAFARVLKLGLVGYLGDGPAPDALDVTWKKPDGATTTGPDPWNYWVFRVSANGFGNGERSSRSLSSFASMSANRTTDNWKILTSVNGSVRSNTFEVEGDTIESRTDFWDVSALVVKSLGPQWSVGATTGLSHSSFSNIDRGVNVAPGLEYNFFPYRESSRRSLTIQYNVGLSHNTYAELTIYDKLSETVPKQFLRGTLTLRQPWGSLNISSRSSQQLDEPARYRASIAGDADVRLFKGFSFNIFGEYEKIGDQISLPKDAASENDVLLRVQQLETSYSYFISFGISYSFGSIFNSVVNPRFSF